MVKQDVGLWNLSSLSCFVLFLLPSCSESCLKTHFGGCSLDRSGLWHGSQEAATCEDNYCFPSLLFVLQWHLQHVTCFPDNWDKTVPPPKSSQSKKHEKELFVTHSCPFMGVNHFRENLTEPSWPRWYHLSAQSSANSAVLCNRPYVGDRDRGRQIRKPIQLLDQGGFVFTAISFYSHKDHGALFLLLQDSGLAYTS